VREIVFILLRTRILHRAWCDRRKSRVLCSRENNSCSTRKVRPFSYRER